MPSREFRWPTRVFASNMLKTSSSSTVGRTSWVPIVEPVASVSPPFGPGSSSMYLRPSAERGRTRSFEPAGSGSIDLSSFIVTCA